MAERIRTLLLGATALTHAFSLASVLQPTPPIGFNDWSQSECGLNEYVFVKTAHAMVNNGLLAAGYNRINVDDCWSTFFRAVNGSMVWNSEKFPHGLPWLTSYLKELGFSPGIYTDAGNLSCGGYPGAYGYGELDAQTFAEWGFEYLKLDGCNMPTETEEEYREVYGKWHEILSNMESPIVFSKSAPAYFAEAANLTDWFSVMDWVPKFEITGWDSVVFNYGQVRVARYQRPGYFNDPDFLNVDHFDYTLDEKKPHFVVWASFSAPPIISAWIPGFSAAEIEYLTNEDMIAVNQDPLALQATLVSQDGTWNALTKDLANSDCLLTVINRGNHTASYSVPFKKIELPSLDGVAVKDLWTASTSFDYKQVTASSVPSHGTAVFGLSALGGSCNVTPTGMIFNAFPLTTLTPSGKGVSWQNSTGVDGQVWKTRDDGTIRSIANERSCLTDAGRGEVVMAPCSWRQNQKWDYLYSGNVKSRSSGLCLTEATNEAVVTAKCLYEDNTQVLALPGGVDIVDS